MPNLDINFASVNMAGTQKPPCHGLRRLFYTATTKNTIFINHQKFHYHEKSKAKDLTLEKETVEMTTPTIAC